MATPKNKKQSKQQSKQQSKKQSEEQSLNLATLPDYAVLSPNQLAALIPGFSIMNQWRARQRGEGPPRIQLSPGRVGYRLGDVRAWLAAREKPMTLRPRPRRRLSPDTREKA